MIQINGARWHMPIIHNTQDKISYQLALREGLAHQQQQFSFPVADGGKLKMYRFHVIGMEKINTPLRALAAIKLERLPMPNKEHVMLWFAPSLSHIVVRVEQRKHIIDTGTAEITHLVEM